MKNRETTFGKIIYNARKHKNLNLRQCAALIMKEDNTPISFQYLNNVEKDRKKPPSEYIINQLSKVLDVPIELLYFYAEIFPKNLDKNADKDKIIEAYKYFVKSLAQKTRA
jgi:transcriptional regulator with XRE-family HTH domain